LISIKTTRQSAVPSTSPQLFMSVGSMHTNTSLGRLSSAETCREFDICNELYFIKSIFWSIN